MKVTGRWLGGLLAALMMVGCVSGCGGENTPASEVPGTAGSLTASRPQGQAGFDLEGITDPSGGTLPGGSGAPQGNGGGTVATDKEGNTVATTTIKLTAANTTASRPVDLDKVDLGGRTITMFRNGYVQSEFTKNEYGQRFLKQLEEVGKELNCKIQMAPSTMNYDSIRVSINAGVPSVDILDGGGPHMLSSWIGTNMVMQLDMLNVFNFSENKFEKSIIDATTYKGHHYGVYPKLQGIEKIQFYNVLVYNKDLLERAGVTEDIQQLQKSGQWTWDKFRSICEKINDPENGIYAIAGSDQGTNDSYFYVNLVESNNGRLVTNGSNGYTFTAGSTNAKAALNYYARDLKPYVKPDANVSTFLTGKIGFIAVYAERLQRGFPDMSDDYGITYMPKGPNADGYYAYTNWYSYYTIPNGVRAPQDVAIVLNQICEPVFTNAEDTRATRLQLESLVRDQESFNVLSGLNQNGRTHAVYDCDALMVGQSGWSGQGWLNVYVPSVFEGTMTADVALETVQNQYTQKIADIWK